VVRGRVVFVVLRSGDDDHDTDELSDALPLARFLPSHSRGLTGLDDQGAVETGDRRINNRFPPEPFSFCRQRQNRPRTRRRKGWRVHMMRDCPSPRGEQTPLVNLPTFRGRARRARVRLMR
jgi:hypothetical protein